MIVITAPTGNIGRRLLSLLVEAAPAREEELRVVVRDPARLPDAVRGRVEVVTGSHGDAATVERAFAGADAVFWLVPPDGSVTPRCSMRSSAWLVNNRSQFHHSGNVGIEGLVEGRS